MLKDFKAFIMRGNVVDMAVGIIIGAAFQLDFFKTGESKRFAIDAENSI